MSPEFAGLADRLVGTQHNLNKIILLCVRISVFLIKIIKLPKENNILLQCTNGPNPKQYTELTLLSLVCLF